VTGNDRESMPAMEPVALPPERDTPGIEDLEHVRSPVRSRRCPRSVTASRFRACSLRSYARTLLGQPYTGEPETIAAYRERLLGAKPWNTLTRGIVLPDVMTKPRSEIPGTAEYDAAHER